MKLRITPTQILFRISLQELNKLKNHQLLEDKLSFSKIIFVYGIYIALTAEILSLSYKPDGLKLFVPEKEFRTFVNNHSLYYKNNSVIYGIEVDKGRCHV